MVSISDFKLVLVLNIFLVSFCDGLKISPRNSGRRKTGGLGSLGTSTSIDPHLSVGLIVPYSRFQERKYLSQIKKSVYNVNKESTDGFSFLKKYKFGCGVIKRCQDVKMIMLPSSPSPRQILDTLCDEFLKQNVSTIIYLSNDEAFGRSTASTQYFLQLASYLGIPVIAWNADNSGLERRSQTRLQLQLAPSLEHQVAAMLSILVRYNWQQFSVVTSEIAGHDDFKQAVRDKVAEMKSQGRFSFRIQLEAKVSSKEDLRKVKQTETRILLLYATRAEGENIMKWATEFGLTTKNYIWIATQSVISKEKRALNNFPPGMLGVSFNTDDADLREQIPIAIDVFARGVEAFVNDKSTVDQNLIPHLSCEGNDDGQAAVETSTRSMGNSETVQRGDGSETKWTLGETFHRYLREVVIHGGFGQPNVSFSHDGTLKEVELRIMNLRPALHNQLVWEEIGEWKSYEEENEGLDIKDIVWPGGSHVPPEGVPDKFSLTIGFLEEAPFISLSPPDPITKKCNVDRGVPCRVSKKNSTSGEKFDTMHKNNIATNSSGKINDEYEYQCCSGFCIDLLAKFAKDLKFEYELVRTEDPKWGVLKDGKWNGLMKELVEKKFDMVLTALKINGDREAAVDFTAPFLESGTSILVLKRTGIISPTAFLEPFDAASWLLVVVAAVQISAFTIFFFEWLSPAGYNMKASPGPNHNFSLFRTYWMVWSLLFQAPVNMDVPRAFTARFMAAVWALFAVVFLAIYTANLAAFMITREEWYDFSGLDDTRLSNPLSMKPPLVYGTVPWTYTEGAIKKSFPQMYEYIKWYNKSNAMEGVNAVKRGELNAFIYDATVLEYLVAHDEECKLLTVGTWHAMTGYGAAFPRNSKHFHNFNRKIMEYTEFGDLERLRRFWLLGTCNPYKQEQKASEPLAPEQFLSAFLILLCGILIATGLMGMEHGYMKWMRGKIHKATDSPGCMAMISLSVGKSLTFRGAVSEASELLRTHRCKDPICDTHLWKVKHELDMARMKMKSLEAQLEAKGIQSPLLINSFESGIDSKNSSSGDIAQKQTLLEHNTYTNSASMSEQCHTKLERKTSWWKTLFQAGIGIGDPLSEDCVDNLPTGNYNLNDENAPSLRMPMATIDTRASEDEQQHNVDKSQSNISETTTGKCVTLQQYKEQGAPKYAVVTKPVGKIANEPRHRECRQTNNASVDNEKFSQLSRAIKKRAEEHRNINENKFQGTFETSGDCNRGPNLEEKEDVRNLGITEHNLHTSDENIRQVPSGGGSAHIQNSTLVCHQTGGNKQSQEIPSQYDTYPCEGISAKQKQFSHVVFSSSSKSPSPSQVHAYASQSSADTSYQNPPPLYADASSSASSSKKIMHGELSKYEKQRQQGDYKQEVASISRPQQISFAQVSPASSQSTSADPYNFPPGYNSNSATQQRYRRKKNATYSREFHNKTIQSEQKSQILSHGREISEIETVL